MKRLQKTWISSAHQGFVTDGVHSNTLAAYRLAAEKGADMIETDERTTRDGVIIANHDPIVKGFDENGEAVWPGIAVDSTNKTQFLFKINKGIFSARDNKRLNSSMAEEKKRVPFTNMIYFGDGETDVPCMKIVSMFGGNSVAVYAPGNEKKRAIAQRLKKQGRVRFTVPAQYTADSTAYRLVCAIIDKIKADTVLQQFSK